MANRGNHAKIASREHVSSSREAKNIRPIMEIWDSALAV